MKANEESLEQLVRGFKDTASRCRKLSDGTAALIKWMQAVGYCPDDDVVAWADRVHPGRVECQTVGLMLIRQAINGEVSSDE